MFKLLTTSRIFHRNSTNSIRQCNLLNTTFSRFCTSLTRNLEDIEM